MTPDRRLAAIGFVLAGDAAVVTAAFYWCRAAWRYRADRACPRPVDVSISYRSLLDRVTPWRAASETSRLTRWAAVWTVVSVTLTTISRMLG